MDCRYLLVHWLPGDSTMSLVPGVNIEFLKLFEFPVIDTRLSSSWAVKLLKVSWMENWGSFTALLNLCILMRPFSVTKDSPFSAWSKYYSKMMVQWHFEWNCLYWKVIIHLYFTIIVQTKDHPINARETRLNRSFQFFSFVLITWTIINFV